MKVRSGRVIGGTVHVEGEPLAEGATVAVVTQDDGPVLLTPDEEQELKLAIEEADRGEFVGPADLFKDQA